MTPKTRSHGDGTLYYRHNAAGQTSRVCVELMIGTTVAADGMRRKQMWRGSVAVKVPGDAKSTEAARKEAERALKAAIKEHHRGELFGGSDQAFGDYLAAWLRDTIAPRARPRTTLTYRLLLEKHCYPFVGRIKLRSLTPQHLRTLYAERVQAVRPGTVRLLHQVIKQALKEALRDNLIPRNVAELVDPPRVPHEELATFSLPDAKAFLVAADADNYCALWRLLLYTGVRIGEALALRWSDAELDAGILHVRRTVQRLPGGGHVFGETKTRRSERDLPLHASVVDALRKHRAAQNVVRIKQRTWEDDDLIFCNTLGKPLDVSYLRRFFRAVLVKAGLPQTRLHDLRHSAATLLQANGADIVTVSRMLGHSNIATTADVYTSTVQASQRSAVDRLGDALG